MNKIYPILIIMFLALPLSVKAEAEVYSIEDAVEYAMQNHPTIIAGEAGVQAERELLNRAYSSFYPSAHLAGSYERLSDIPTPAFLIPGASDEEYTLGLILEYPIYTGGLRKASVNLRKNSLRAEGEELNDLRSEVSFRVREAYYALDFADRILSIREESVRNLEEFRISAERLHAMRKIPRREEILRIEAELATAKSELLEAESLVENSRRKLLQSMGRDPSGSIEISDSYRDYSLNTGIETSLESNYLLKSFDYRIRGAGEAVKAARAEKLPKAALGYSYAYRGFELSGLEERWSVSVNAYLPLFTGGRISSETGEREGLLVELSNTARAVEEEISLKLLTTIREFKRAGESLEFAEEAVRKAGESLDIYEKRYSDGTSSSRDLLEAKRDFIQSRLRLEEILLRKATAGIGIVRITGE